MRFLLRFVATLLTLAGLAGLVAAVGAFKILPEDSSARPVVWIIVHMAAAIMLGSGAALYALRTPRIRDARPLPFVRVVLPVLLVAAPAWMVWRLQSFLEEWGHVIEIGTASRMWQDASSNVGGIVLVPIAAALMPPFIELATMGGFLIAALVLVGLLLRGSATCLRVYVVWALLLTGMVVVCSRGATAAGRAATIVEGALQNSDRDGTELDQVRQFVSRYTTAVNEAEGVLWWTLGAYLVGLPLLLVSTLVRPRT